MSDKALREQLVRALDWDHAHIRFENAVKEFPRELRGKRPANGPHSAWELLEHLRLAQWDILEFSRDANHKSPEFPAGYWPASVAPADDAEWDRSVAQYQSDLKELESLTSDASVDLFAKIPHGDGQTLLRQILLTLDHNAYHLGQLMIVRKTLEG